MEIEQTQPALANKLWNILKIAFFMLKKEISNSKLMLDLFTLLKHAKLFGKNLGHAMLHHHHAALGCHCSSTDIQLSYVSNSKGHYEFSCSSTPLNPVFFSSRRKSHQRYTSCRPKEIKMVKNIFDILKNYETPVEASPLVALPGFGKSPRVTDSPFPLKGEDHEDINQVDKMCEEFISKFYKDLKNQKRVAALQSPSPYHMRLKNVRKQNGDVVSLCRLHVFLLDIYSTYQRLRVFTKSLLRVSFDIYLLNPLSSNKFLLFFFR